MIRLHAVRHSLGTAPVEAGVPPVDAAAMLGRTLQVSLSTYAGSTSEGLAAAADTLGAVFAAAR